MAKRKYKTKGKKIKVKKAVVLKSYSFPEHSLTIRAENMKDALSKLKKLGEGVNK